MYYLVDAHKSHSDVCLVKYNFRHTGSLTCEAGQRKVELQLGMQVFQVCVIVVETLTEGLILGRDFLKKHNCSVKSYVGEQNLL